MEQLGQLEDKLAVGEVDNKEEEHLLRKNINYSNNTIVKFFYLYILPGGGILAEEGILAGVDSLAGVDNLVVGDSLVAI